MAQKKNEVPWTKDVLIPRLSQLGFSSIDFVHGTMEAGRDVVFADSDKFGIIHFYAAQVKSGSLRSRSESLELRSIIQQLSFAYETPYTDPVSGSVHKIRGVYLIVDGEVSVPARQILNNRLGQWLHVIDKRHLDVAGAFAVHVSEEKRRSRIVALRLELSFELHQIPKLIENAETALAATDTATVHLLSRPMRTKALDRYMEIAYEELAPLDVVVLHNIRDAADILNFVVGRLPLGPMDQVVVEPTLRTLITTGNFLQKQIPLAKSLLLYALGKKGPAVGDYLEPWPENPAAGGGPLG